jgi:hypothetical protein
LGAPTAADSPDDVGLAFTLPVAFTHPDSPPPPLNVLGRQGFLDRFAVALEGYRLPPCLYLSQRRR